MKFIPKKIDESGIGAVGQAGWYFTFQCVVVKVECLQSEQMTNFMWDFTIKAVVLKIDEPKKGEVANVR